LSPAPGGRLTPRLYRILTIGFLSLGILCLLAIGAVNARTRYLTRGIPNALPENIPEGGVELGVNVDLQRYQPDELKEVLKIIKGTGISHVKQAFYFSEDFDWATSDRLIAATTEAGLDLVPLLDGNPGDKFAPPADFTDFGAWAGEFAGRYGESISHYIIWDEPNLSSHWGDQPVNPSDFAALFSHAAAAIRKQDDDVVIVLSPLAPTTETGPENLAEPLFLKALYEAGLGDSFDVISGKPYGFDTGPDDRRVDIDQLNFSRIILLRELLESQGDGHKAIWVGNWGWNSLPPDWSGDPSLWGQTSEKQRSAWTIAALERARREWPWMGVMFLENWEPGAADDDPRWGFRIAGRQTAADLATYLDTLPADTAWPGFHLAAPDDLAQTFSGRWEFSPEYGADIGQSGDQAIFKFWGTDVGLRVRRADYRARIHATIDDQPANALPRDEQGTALILTAEDPAEDLLTTEIIATGLDPGPHTLEITASRGWDQWSLNGFSVGYRLPETRFQSAIAIFAGLATISILLAIISSRRGDWQEWGTRIHQAFIKLSDYGQLILTLLLAALVGVTGWLVWGEGALGVYRRLGDLGQLAATATAAAIFYVTPYFLVYLLALGILYFLLILRPAWGVALIALTMPLYTSTLAKPMLGYQFSPVEVFTVIATLAWVTRWLLDYSRLTQNRQHHWQLPPMRSADWAVVAFLLVGTISLFFTRRLDVATNEWRVVILEPILFYFLLRVTRLKGREVWVVLDAWVISGLVVAIYGLWQYATGQNLITAEGGLLRLRAFYGSPNNVALYLDRVLPLLVAMFLLGRAAGQRNRHVLYSLAIIPIALTLVLTFSKGALLLGVPASMLVVFWLWQRNAGRRAWPWIVAIILGGFATFAIAIQIPALAARLDLFGTTGVFRLNLWRSAINMIADHPLFGVGLDNFLYAYRGRYILDAAWQEPNLSHPHNIILDFAARIGLVGLLVGSWMIFEAGKTLISALRKSRPTWLPVTVGMSGALVAMLAHGLVDHSFFLVDLAFTFFLILGIAVWLDKPFPPN
jgi:O-antigen ligase